MRLPILCTKAGLDTHRHSERLESYASIPDEERALAED